MKDDWDRVFSSLSDAAFFEVIRHYLGPVSTPYHKPELINSLIGFLNREEVRRHSIAYIDETDALLLSCIDLCGSVSKGILTQLIPGIKNFAVHKHILNLEERLLIWKSTVNDQDVRYALTPLGESIREAGYIGPGAILGRDTGDLEENPQPWFNDIFFNSILNFLAESHLLLRVDGTWRKKTLEMMRQRFCFLFHDERGEARINIIGHVLMQANLVSLNQCELEVNLKAWQDLEDCSPSDRRAVMISYAIQRYGLSMNTAARIVHIFTEMLPPSKAYEAEKMIHLIQIIASESSLLSPRNARRILSTLVLLGELVPGENGRLGRPDPGQQIENNTLSITPAGDIICRPGFPLSCALSLAASEMRYETVLSCRLVKERFLAGMDADVAPGSLIQVIERHSGYPIPDNIAIMIQEWSKEYDSLSLQFGLVLVAKGRQLSIIEETQALKDHAISHPSKGLWLLDYADRKSWSQTLVKIGLKHIPRVRGLPGFLSKMITEKLNELKTKDIRPLDRWSSVTTASKPVHLNWQAPDYPLPTTILEELAGHPAVEELSAEEMGIFHQRLNRRLILAPEQIRPGAWRTGIMNATGLDYQAKLNLAEAAMKERNEWLKISLAWGNEMESITIIPRHITKQGENHILSGYSIPNEEPVEYPMSKIGYLERVKISLF